MCKFIDILEVLVTKHPHPKLLACGKCVTKKKKSCFPLYSILLAILPKGWIASAHRLIGNPASILHAVSCTPPSERSGKEPKTFFPFQSLII